MTRPRGLDLGCGEGGTSMGLHRAGFDMTGVDRSAARLKRYPFKGIRGDYIEYVLEHGHEYDLIIAGPTCTGYSRGTAAVPDRVAKYDRLIGATREAILTTGRPYVIENVADARPELVNPVLLCGRQFGLTAVDDDGTPLVLDRHRLFESNVLLIVPEHLPHDKALQVAGAYSGGRRDKWEARHIRQGGYVPSGDVQRRLLGVPWMTDIGARLSVPPAYTEYLGHQLLVHLEAGAA